MHGDILLDATSKMSQRAGAAAAHPADDGASKGSRSPGDTKGSDCGGAGEAGEELRDPWALDEKKEAAGAAGGAAKAAASASSVFDDWF